MKAADNIELDSVNDVNDDDKSPVGATARYDYPGIPANHVTNRPMTTGETVAEYQPCWVSFANARGMAEVVTPSCQ